VLGALCSFGGTFILCGMERTFWSMGVKSGSGCGMEYARANEEAEGLEIGLLMK